MKVFKMHIGPAPHTDKILFLHFKEIINVGLFLQMLCLVGGCFAPHIKMCYY